MLKDSDKYRLGTIRQRDEALAALVLRHVGNPAIDSALDRQALFSYIAATETDDLARPEPFKGSKPQNQTFADFKAHLRALKILSRHGALFAGSGD